MMNVEFMNKVDNIYTDGKSSTLNMGKLAYFDESQYDLSDEKDFKFFIRDLERVVRNSFEYRTLIKYLKDTEGMDVCSFLENVTSRDNKKVSIEIHHTPLTLYDICMAVYKKRFNKHQDIDINSIAEEVMWLHYSGWVGLIPLSATVHDLVHNQYLFIPTNVIRGNYKAFIETYYDYIEPEVLDAIDAAEQATIDYNNKQMNIFNNHTIYVNMNDVNLKESISDHKESIKDHIDAIKNKKI